MKRYEFETSKISLRRALGAVILLGAFGAPYPVFAQDVAIDPASSFEAQELAAPEDAIGMDGIENFEEGTMPEETLSSPEIDAIGKDLSALPDAVKAQDPDENIFFDAQALVPSGEMGRKSGPVKVNPRTQPASKLISVRKNNTAGSKAAQLVSADRAMKLARYESALGIYDSIYATNKRDPNVLMGRAVALQHLGRDDEAIGVYDDLLEIRPNNIDAQINMLGLMASQYPAVALRRLETLSNQHASNPGVIAQLAFIHAKMTNYSEAIRYLGMAASMEPKNANHIYNMAVIADRAGSKTEAIKYYEQALEVDTLYGAGKTIPRENVFSRLAQIR